MGITLAIDYLVRTDAVIR